MLGVVSMLRSALSHPLTRGIDPDDPRTTALRRRIIAEKPFVRRIYDEWYSLLQSDLPRGDGRVLELGSGAGFFKEYVPETITSEIFMCPGIDIVADAQNLGMADHSLRAIVMTDVLHHLPDVRRFFTEATRTIRPGGVIAMIEPWVSWWSKIIYPRLHHEPFRPDADRWSFNTSGPLSGANGALPWIVFKRDREVFKRDFPDWHIDRVEPIMPLRYLISGGVSMRTLIPLALYEPMRWTETLFGRGSAMFAHIVLRRR
jgi:SAM-dependent methyltransferase